MHRSWPRSARVARVGKGDQVRSSVLRRAGSLARRIWRPGGSGVYGAAVRAVVSRLVLVSALLAGLFLMHGLAGSVGADCHGAAAAASVAMAMRPTSGGSHLAMGMPEAAAWPGGGVAAAALATAPAGGAHQGWVVRVHAAPVGDAPAAGASPAWGSRPLPALGVGRGWAGGPGGIGLAGAAAGRCAVVDEGGRRAEVTAPAGPGRVAPGPFLRVSPCSAHAAM
jgi:hypothetical protein